MPDPYLASNEFPGDGVTTLYNISFKGNRPDAGSGVVPYLSTADVKAQIITSATASTAEIVEDVPIVYVGPNQFSVTPATPVGKITRIYRATQDEYALVDYQSLQTVGEADLDLSNRQVIFVTQEAHDLALRATIVASETNQVAYDAATAAAEAAVVAADAAVVAQDAANHATAVANSTALALTKTVRIPAAEAAIPELPAIAARANKLMSFDASGNPTAIAAVNQSATDLELRLADPTDPSKGAGMVALPIPSPSSIPRTVTDAFGDHLNILSFRTPASDAGRWDIALQAAIAVVEALAVTANRTHGLPAIVVPGGLYPMGASVTTRPWVKIVALGSVTFDWTSVPASNGFVVNNQITIPADLLSHPGNHSPCLNGMSGTISLLGAGRAISTGSALLIGNSSTGFQPCRDTRLANVVVSGWDSAQKFNLRDTYLFHAENCRFQNNNKNINVPTGTNTNSGERMEYVSCTFGIADHQLYQDNITFDFSFISCSFDFFGHLVTYGTSAAYCSARFATCYFEAWDGFLVNAPGPVEQVAVFFTDAIFLPRKWQDATIANSPSRLLVNTNDKVSISWGNPKMRYETRPYLEDSYTISAATRLESYTGYHFNPQMGLPSAANIINRDYDFQIDADGTLGNVLTAWDRLAGFTAVTTNQIATVSGKKVLQLVGTDAVTAAITFRGKDNIPARAGEQFLCTACIQADGGTGNKTVLMGVEFFDIAGVSLGTFPSFRQYVFKDALDDTTLPNFASGGIRYMDTAAFKAIAPKNTAYARARFTMTAFNGTVNVSRARVWKA